VNEDLWIRGRGHDGGVYITGEYGEGSIAEPELESRVFKTPHGHMKSKFSVTSSQAPPEASVVPSFTQIKFETKNVEDGDVQTTRTTTYDPPVNI
jgi:hypothetical protein